MANAFVAWRTGRRAVRELSRLSDRSLADLGIARRDIAAVAARAAAASARPGAIRRPVSAGLEAMAPSWAAHNRRIQLA